MFELELLELLLKSNTATLERWDKFWGGAPRISWNLWIELETYKMSWNSCDFLTSFKFLYLIKMTFYFHEELVFFAPELDVT